MMVIMVVVVKMTVDSGDWKNWRKSDCPVKSGKKVS